LRPKEEGIEARWARHRELGETTRQMVSELGLEFVAEEGYRADTVTAFWVKEGLAGGIAKTLSDRHGIVVSRGIYEARDRMIRIGHFGILTVARLRAALDSIEKVLIELGASKGQVPLAKRQ